jgi:hypothetical protein
MADLAVVARDTVIGMPATRFLGPALGSLHMFFHRRGPVLAGGCCSPAFELRDAHFEVPEA